MHDRGIQLEPTAPPSPPDRDQPSSSMLVNLLDRVPSGIAGAVIAALVVTVYLYELGRNPVGFFCDEALIGLKAQELIRGDRPDGAFPFFFDHFGYTAGALPLFTTAPFVWLFGLNEFAVRLASAFFMLATFVVLILTFRHLKVGTPWLPVLIFALSPIVIHLSRVNFGHTPSLFFIATGYYLYLLGQARQRILLSALGGAAIGISAYGNMVFYLGTMIFIAVLAGSELVFIRFHWRRMKHLTIVIGSAIVCLLPIAYQARTSADFAKRFDDKDVAGYSLLSVDRVESMIQNVQKYYSYDFLFAVGENGMPHAHLVRHSVSGAGLLSRTTLPFLVLGLLTFALVKGGSRKRAFAPFVALTLLYPLPDLITTTRLNPPYAYSMFTASLLVPFVAAYGLEALGMHRASLARGMQRDRVSNDVPAGRQPPDGAEPEAREPREHDPAAAASLRPARPHLLMQVWLQLISVRFIALAVAVAGFFFFFATYATYPLVSSGYWGWQSGPRDIIGYYLDHQDEYDAFYMEGIFNESQVFLDFYIDDPEARNKAFIGGVNILEGSGDTPFTGRRELFGISQETWNAAETRPLFSAFTIVEVVSYPDGLDAFYLIERVR